MPDFSDFLTPDTVPNAEQCRALFFPEDQRWLAAVAGALSLLTDPASWEQYGALTPDQAAAAFQPYFDRFSFNEGACRVIGEIICFAGAVSPNAKWLLCNGASLLRASYPDLFSVIGTTYGAVDSTHFTLPDLRGRVALGAGQGPGLTNRALGAALGEESHVLSSAEMPAHVHSQSYPLTLPAGAPGEPNLVIAGATSFATGSVGGGGAHNNIQPVLAINFFIVALP